MDSNYIPYLYVFIGIYKFKYESREYCFKEYTDRRKNC
jgi:hypothetical protein